MEDKEKYKHIKGLILDEEEARKNNHKTMFLKICPGVRIGFNPENRKLIFFHITFPSHSIKFAIPVVNLQINDEREVWDEKHEVTHG